MQPNYRKMILYKPLFELSLIWLSTVESLKLIDKGFTTEELANLESKFFPVDLLIIFIIGRFNFKDNYPKIMNISIHILYLVVRFN